MSAVEAWLPTMDSVIWHGLCESDAGRHSWSS